MKTLILGLGNPILSDDSVGLHVARVLESKLNHQEINVMEAGAAGLDILELITGYEKVIIIDAIQAAGVKVGQIYRLMPESLDATRHASTPHDVNFATAIGLGNKLNLDLPHQIVIFAIGVADVDSFSEMCTPEVERAIPLCVERIIQELGADTSACT